VLPPETTRESARLRELQDLVEREDLGCGFGVLHQPVGQAPWIESPGEIDRGYLDRARAVELEALLRLSNAVWTPDDYHYLLPSGEHAPGFVRLANAVREPRDAEVLASWLHRHIRDGLGLVLDTGTLSPVALALHAEMRAAGLEPGPVEVLRGYPATQYDVSRAVRNAQRENAVLALLSVNSSGRVLSLLLDGMRSVVPIPVPGAPYQAIETFISKQPVEAHADQESGVSVAMWHPRPGGAPLVAYGAEAKRTCELCTSEDRATLVPISPDSFEGTFTATINTLTPSVPDADFNRALWEQCDRGEVIYLNAQPRSEVSIHRPPGRMAVRIDMNTLIERPDFRDAVVHALSHQLARSGESLEADLVLMREDEAEAAGAAELVEALSPILGEDAAIKAFPHRGDWGAELKSTVSSAKKIVVLALGAVSGTTLQNALVAAQRAREPGYPISGLVLHARLPERRAWQTLKNSYGGRLFYAFHSYLPLISPLDAEAQTLDELRSDGGSLPEGAIEEFFDRRRRFCAEPGDEPELGLFWGSQPKQTVTPNSIFGEALRGPAVYLAVASAMERARKEARARATPERRVFELSAIVRSYYDPLILSAILRWLRPHEAFWGYQLYEAETTVMEMLGRAPAEDRRVLIPELLLAAAQGKVTRPGVLAARACAQAMLDGDDLSDEAKAALQLGLLLTPSYNGEETERLKGEASERWAEGQS
jgi:hypothetical protein